MKRLLKFLLFVGAVAGAAWALRDQLMPPPQQPSADPPPFRTSESPATLHAEPDVEDLTRVNGIGPVRVEQLAETGIRTFADLATADAADIASRLGVSTAQVEDWIAQAADLG